MTDQRLIVALDPPQVAHAHAGEAMADRLSPDVGFYKIGLGMLTGGGLALAIELKSRGHKVFLDLKLFDIGATVEAAVAGLSGFGLDFLTVHGDPNVVRAAVAGRGSSGMKILAVTILTSSDRGDLDAAMIVDGDPAEIVTERARRALRAGADGVIASPLEAAAIRALPEARGRLIVCPGVRPAGAARGDQKRVATPEAALKAGADHIVVGRPVTAAPDPAAAARAILKEISAL
ncbi:MAG: orotidine-5'-phosphate decarboxylase [Paracoccaceae bacterium]